MKNVNCVSLGRQLYLISQDRITPLFITYPFCLYSKINNLFAAHLFQNIIWSLGRISSHFKSSVKVKIELHIFFDFVKSSLNRKSVSNNSYLCQMVCIIFCFVIVDYPLPKVSIYKYTLLYPKK